MGRLIGHGRYRSETYPEGSGGPGGGSAAIVPLTRQRFIDGGTTQPGLTGSAAEPYKTIAQFMASRGNVSAPDATANYVGWVMPALAGYPEAVSFPPYASTELRADSFGGAPPSVEVSSVVWANVAGAHAAATAIAVMHNVSVLGGITITDDGGAPNSVFLFGGDEVAGVSVEMLGVFDAHAAAHLSEVIFYNALVAGGVTADLNTDVVAVGSSLGPISAGGVSGLDSSFSTSITINTQPSNFQNCTFAPGVLLTAVPTVGFDGPSWRNFREGGCTRAVGTVVLVVGGYSGGAVEGAALTGASTSVSLNGTGATAGFTGENSGNHYTTSNGTPTSVTLKTGGGELGGDTILITKTDTGANAVAVKNNAGTTIGTIPANNRGFVLAQFTAGGDWSFLQGGALAA